MVCNTIFICSYVDFHRSDFFGASVDLSSIHAEHLSPARMSRYQPPEEIEQARTQARNEAISLQLEHDHAYNPNFDALLPTDIVIPQEQLYVPTCHLI